MNVFCARPTLGKKTANTRRLVASGVPTVNVGARACLVGLARDVGLAQHLKPLALKHGAGALRIIDVERKRRAPVRTGEERITEMHVYLRHEERREQFRKFGRHSCNSTTTISQIPKATRVRENLFHRLGIADHDAGNGRVGRLGNAERHDMGVAGAEQLYDIQHRANFVGQEDGELLYQRAADLGSGLR